MEQPTAAPTATVELLEMTGRVVWHGTLGGGTQVLPVQQLPAGFYLVRLRTATQLPLISRVVIEH